MHVELLCMMPYVESSWSTCLHEGSNAVSVQTVAGSKQAVRGPLQAARPQRTQLQVSLVQAGELHLSREPVKAFRAFEPV